MFLAASFTSTVSFHTFLPALSIKVIITLSTFSISVTLMFFTKASLSETLMVMVVFSPLFGTVLKYLVSFFVRSLLSTCLPSLVWTLILFSSVIISLHTSEVVVPDVIDGAVVVVYPVLTLLVVVAVVVPEVVTEDVTEGVVLVVDVTSFVVLEPLVVVATVVPLVP
jgi:hypothetical protein